MSRWRSKRQTSARSNEAPAKAAGAKVTLLWIPVCSPRGERASGIAQRRQHGWICLFIGLFGGDFTSEAIQVKINNTDVWKYCFHGFQIICVLGKGHASYSARMCAVGVMWDTRRLGENKPASCCVWGMFECKVTRWRSAPTLKTLADLTDKVTQTGNRMQMATTCVHLTHLLSNRLH